MEKVLGFGGFFFRASDPTALGQWYRDALGVDLPPPTYDAPVWQQQAGPTVFSGFAQDSTMFGRPDRHWMLNFRVRDLDAMVDQLQQKGVAVEIDPETYPNGRFAYFKDPEGNPLQIWEPAGRDG